METVDPKTPTNGGTTGSEGKKEGAGNETPETPNTTSELESFDRTGGNQEFPDFFGEEDGAKQVI